MSASAQIRHHTGHLFGAQSVNDAACKLQTED